MFDKEPMTVPGWLLGRWRLQQAEAGVEILPDTLMEFRRGGELTYTITLEGRQATFDLSYQLTDGMLFTRYSSGEHSAAAGVSLDASGLLEFNFNGRRAWFAREILM
jgi:hypothetical protein